MSDYTEPRRHTTSPLYLASAIIGTILALSALKFAFGLDIIGGLIEFLTSFSDGFTTRTDYWKDLTSAFFDRID